MRLKHLIITTTLCCALCSALSAASPFAGKWKLNQAKSHFTGQSDSVTAAGPNTWKFAYGSFSWTIKADGTDQPTPFGNTWAMKVVNASTWEFTSKIKGKVTETDTWALSADGKSMTRTSSGKHENGEAFTNVSTMKRTAGTSGFEGTWETAELKASFPELDIEPNGEDGITLCVPAENVKFSVKFDGKEYPVEGPRIPAGMTVSAKLVNPRKANATTKLKDKVIDAEEWAVSADGKTFTYTEHDSGVAKPFVGVYDRM